mmetsp:Transcript_18342/g.37040  ORF Transcript_18342/g.37040 Transcript_18342/m.37040 type:complete len:222 (-) Transcript_18342:251-916(-)
MIIYSEFSTEIYKFHFFSANITTMCQLSTTTTTTSTPAMPQGNSQATMTNRQEVDDASTTSSNPTKQQSFRRHNSSNKRRRLVSLLKKLCGYGKGSNSKLMGRFGGVEDSVHVMLRHDKERAQKKGLQTKGYTPRKPLSSVVRDVAAANDAAAASPDNSIPDKTNEDGSSSNRSLEKRLGIQATEEEEESETDKKLLAALANNETESCLIAMSAVSPSLAQ